MAVNFKTQTKVSRWGNSLAVRLPAALLERAHIDQNDDVEISVQGDEITIKRVAHKVTMEELLRNFDPERHRREPMFDVAPNGTETAK